MLFLNRRRATLARGYGWRGQISVAFVDHFVALADRRGGWGWTIARDDGVAAGVRSSTQIEAYRVGGTTAASLVSYMRNHPYPGEHGDAVANIVPRYSLSIATKNAGGRVQGKQRRPQRPLPDDAAARDQCVGHVPGDA